MEAMVEVETGAGIITEMEAQIDINMVAIAHARTERALQL